MHEHSTYRIALYTALDTLEHSMRCEPHEAVGYVNQSCEIIKTIAEQGIRIKAFSPEELVQLADGFERIASLDRAHVLTEGPAAVRELRDLFKPDIDRAREAANNLTN